jgi:hypothetical protein
LNLKKLEDKARKLDQEEIFKLLDKEVTLVILSRWIKVVSAART